MDTSYWEQESPPQKLVILAGPHESSWFTSSTTTTSSSSWNNDDDDNDEHDVYRFFSKHARNEDRLLSEQSLPALENWTWPYHPRADDPYAYDDLVKLTTTTNHHSSHKHQHHSNANSNANSKNSEDHPDNQQQQYQDEDRKRELWSTILAIWGHKRITHGDYNHHHNLYPKMVNNVIVGTDEFDRLPPYTTFTHRNGLESLQTLLRLTDVPATTFTSTTSTASTPRRDVTIVVNYPFPRAQHWIALWKHQIAYRTSYKGLFCATYTTLSNGTRPIYQNWVTEVAMTAANPLRAVQVYRQQGWNVSLMDTSGIQKAGTTLPQAIACQVLKVPCGKSSSSGGSGRSGGGSSGSSQPKGWIDGYYQTHNDQPWNGQEPTPTPKEHQQQQQPSLSPRLSHEQLQQLEWVFRQRDCYYKNVLWDDPGVTIHYQDSLLFLEDCGTTSSSSSPTQLQTDLALNATLFVSLLESIVGCGSDPKAIHALLSPTTITTTTATTTTKDIPFLSLCGLWGSLGMLVLLASWRLWKFRTTRRVSHQQSTTMTMTTRRRRRWTRRRMVRGKGIPLPR